MRSRLQQTRPRSGAPWSILQCRLQLCPKARPLGRERVAVHHDGLVALTLGAEGAVLLDDGEEIARAEPPRVDAVDGTAAGDAFTACLLVSLLEGHSEPEALTRACAAGALAASRFGAQPSLPTAAEVDALLGG